MIRVESVVIRVDDVQRQAEFWSKALDYVRREGGDDDFVLLRPRDGVGPNISLDQVHSTEQVPPRIHLDLYTEDQAGEATHYRLPHGTCLQGFAYTAIQPTTQLATSPA